MVFSDPASGTQQNSDSGGYPYSCLVPPETLILLPNDPYLNKSTPQYLERCKEVLAGAEEELDSYRKAYNNLRGELVTILGKIDQLEWNIRYIYPLGDTFARDHFSRCQILEAHKSLMEEAQSLAEEGNRCENQLRVCRSMMEHYTRLISAGVRDIARASNETAFARVQDSWVAAELDALDKKHYEDIRTTQYWDESINAIFEKMKAWKASS